MGYLELGSKGVLKYEGDIKRQFEWTATGQMWDTLRIKTNNCRMDCNPSLK